MKKTKTSKMKYFSPFTACAIIVCIVLSVFVLGCNISLNELSLEAANKTKALEQLESQNSVLALQIDRKNSLGNIEEIATQQLGMVKLESFQIHTVNLAGDDSVEIVSKEKDNGFFDGVVASFNILLEYLN
jgi:cell division protein FtsB